jgi:hypothetical protein
MSSAFCCKIFSSVQQFFFSNLLPRLYHPQYGVPYVRINTAAPQHLVNKAFYRKTLHV